MFMPHRTAVVRSTAILTFRPIIAQKNEFGKSPARPSRLRLTDLVRCTIMYIASLGSTPLARRGMAIVARDRVQSLKSRQGSLQAPLATPRCLPDPTVPNRSLSSPLAPVNAEHDRTIALDREPMLRFVGSHDPPVAPSPHRSTRHSSFATITAARSESSRWRMLSMTSDLNEEDVATASGNGRPLTSG
jgi:hypothetical protein